MAQENIQQASTKFLSLARGLYVVRLAALKPGLMLNPVNLAQSPDSPSQVAFFGSENVVRQTIAQPGDCIVLRINDNGGKIIATEFQLGGGSRLVVEPLDRPGLSPLVLEVAGTEQVPRSVPNKKPPVMLNQPLPLEEGEVSVALLGHIQNIGDVVAKDNWLGDPNSNKRLEGFAIKVKDLPKGVRLNYACTFANGKLQPQMTADSQFIGTRQKAQPIKSVVFTLDGEQADQYQLSGEVAFTGGNRVPLVAQEQLAWPDGNGHLVAIHLKITAKPEEEDGLWTEEEIKELFGSL